MVLDQPQSGNSQELHRQADLEIPHLRRKVSRDHPGTRHQQRQPVKDEILGVREEEQPPPVHGTCSSLAPPSAEFNESEKNYKVS